MKSKSVFNAMIEKYFEEMVQSSEHIKKIVHNISIIANESKKIAEFVLIINQKLNSHEELLLRLIEEKKEKKDSFSDYATKSKNDSNKPN